ncbi:MAG: hypothetical protein KF774_11865 [Planctomyces sp.]|nr:hypothetical protein [Planctomyces sp.]
MPPSPQRDELTAESRWYALLGGALTAATWGLWLGQSDFPEIPLFAVGRIVPRGADALLLAAIVASLALTFAPRTRRAAWIGFAIAWGLSACLNQHRIQVWAWHLAVAGVVLAAFPPAAARRRLQWLTISIYAWSAASKLDFGFVEHQGRQLSVGLLTALRIDPTRLPAGAISGLPWAFSLGELLIACLLAKPEARRYGLALSLAMHAALLLALGPLGLNHESGVLLWNVLFIGQNVLLFGRSGRAAASSDEVPAAGDPAPGRGRGLAATAVLWLALVMPVGQSWGWWDVWPSWAVYSARAGWTTILVHADDVERLPESCRPFVQPAAPLSDWRPVNVDAWSLSTLHCPVYPQSRFRWAIAAVLAQRAEVRVETRSPPDRRTGASEFSAWEFSGPELPPDVEGRFLLNVRPRR